MEPEPAHAPTPDTATESVALSWSIPDLRENGDVLEAYEIAGYEILYTKVGEELFTSDIVNDAQQSSYSVDSLSAGDYEFMLAVFDTEGLYSSYVTVNFTVN